MNNHRILWLAAIFFFTMANAGYAKPEAGNSKAHKSERVEASGPKNSQKADSKGKVSVSHKQEKNKSVPIAIPDTDRSILAEYIQTLNTSSNCPPGLAKKANGCLPPGIAKKYAVGSILPSDVVFSPLPGHIRRKLRPVPGYTYVQVDKDVLLIAEASKKVIDAVTLLSGVQ